MSKDAFMPHHSTQMNVSSTSSVVQLSGPNTVDFTVRVAVPAGGPDVFIKFGNDDTVTANATSGMQVFAGKAGIFRVVGSRCYMAAYSSTGTPTVNVTTGQGGG